MTCKDCISFAKCLDFECTPYYGLDAACNNVEQLCEEFKNNADFVEVKHGRWIDTGDEILDTTYSGWKCSECGYVFCGNKFKFCPECGAKMDVSKMEITTDGGKAE